MNTIRRSNVSYKICVYAIAKNEENFVNTWYDSMKEADYIAVLDTGSTDNTFNMLKDLGIITAAHPITPWRFDTARNLSMQLIPDDTDICVCTDLDERFHPGWRTTLEKSWSDDISQAKYRYTWNFNSDGSEGYVFWIEKIHSHKKFIWTHPVHETLKYIGDSKYKSISIPGIQLDHYADPLKSRSQYLPLLELSVKEEPDDDRNVHYLGREYMFYGRWDDCIETLIHHLKMPSAVWADERCASMRYIAKAYKAKNDLLSSKEWLFKAIAEAPYLREPYVDMSLLLSELNEWDGVIYFSNCALKIKERPETYICEAEAWGSTPFDLASLGYFYTKQYDKSLVMAERALEFSPENERLKNNIKLIKNSII